MRAFLLFSYSQLKKIQTLKMQARNPTHVKKRRKPLLERQIDASVEGAAALLVAASLSHLQDERAKGSTLGAEEDGVRAAAGIAVGSGEGEQEQAAAAVPAWSTLEHLHKELQALLGVKVGLTSVCVVCLFACLPARLPLGLLELCRFGHVALDEVERCDRRITSRSQDCLTSSSAHVQH